MSHAAPPALTVRYDGSQRTFAAGHDVVVGRDLRADMRIAHPLISRAHLLLRFDQGRWLAIDNGSLNGIYVNGRRVPVVDIHDGQAINIGNPDGPQLSFEVGRHQGIGGPAAADDVDADRRIAGARPAGDPPRSSRARPPGRRPAAADRPGTVAPVSRRRRRHRATEASARRPTRRARRTRRRPPRPATAPPPVASAPPDDWRRRPEWRRRRSARRPRCGNLATRMIQILRRVAHSGQAAGLGRRSVAPTTTTSSSPTCWRRAITRSWSDRRPAPRSATRTASTAPSSTASRVGSAVLHDGDVVTIGNVDLVFTDGTLVRRTEAGDPHRRPRGARRRLRRSTARDLLDRHLADRPAGHADRDHRRRPARARPRCRG